MKLHEAIDIIPSLTKLGEVKLPIRASFKIARFLNSVKSEIQTFEETRLKLAQEVGTPNEDGQSFSIPEDKAADFTKQVVDLLQVDINTPALSLKVSEFGESTEIESNILLSLANVIEED